MKLFNSIICALWLGTFSLTQAGPLATRASSSPPTRRFTVSVFETPYPVGTGITGYNLTARGGNLYLSPKHDVQKAVLFVDGDGKAYLDSKKKERLYVDTYTGLLAYQNPPPPNARFVDFIHLGHGNTIDNPGDEDRASQPGQSLFEWHGTEPDFWFACGAGPDGPGEEYQLWKYVFVFGGVPNVSTCPGVFLSALDYTGKSPAVDSYP